MPSFWQVATDSIMSISRDTFGEPVTYQAVNGGPVQMVGIFEEASAFDTLDSAAEMEGAVAFIDFRSSDLAFKPKKGDMILINATGKPFKIIKPEFDGFARWRCYLREFV